MKSPTARLTADFSFTSIYDEVITLPKGSILGVVEAASFTPKFHRNCIYQISKGSYMTIQIPMGFLADYSPSAVAHAIRSKNNK